MNDHRIGIVHHSDPIIIGSGIAGLTTALGLQGCTVVTAARIGSGSSDLAQGGVAAAIGRDDDPARHALDTRTIGGQIVDARVADLVAAAAASQVEWWRELGVEFDADHGGEVALGREAGHSARRIVHAGGDATGAEIMRVLRLATVSRSDIGLLPQTRLVDLIRSGDRIVGALTHSAQGATTAHIAPAVVMATGGIGGVYDRSTNPLDVTGTGLASAARQGVHLADLEFVQFHPTALVSPDHPAPLVTEALRGEGATLIDETGRRFMTLIHRDAELAPRDILARSISMHLDEGHRVFVDARQAIGQTMPERFPTVYALAAKAGIDARTEPIPVAPAEHFHMGGIATDTAGRTSIAGLWAVGEVASTGLHGANRLASNSLLEATVMGQRASHAIPSDLSDDLHGELLVPRGSVERMTEDEDRLHRVRSIASAHIGIVRNETGLLAALDAINQVSDIASDAATVASLIASAALERRESRGAHFRSDHPSDDPRQATRSIVVPDKPDLVHLEPSSVVAR